MDKQEQQHFFERIIEQHKGLLFKVARAYCSDAVDRQDLRPELMIQIWQSIHKYNDQYKISTWLYRISLNVAISFYRKSSTRAKKHTVLNEQMTEMPTEEKSENEQHLNYGQADARLRQHSLHGFRDQICRGIYRNRRPFNPLRSLRLLTCKGNGRRLLLLVVAFRTNERSR